MHGDNGSVGVAPVGEDGGVVDVEDLEVAPGELGAVAVALDEQADPRQEGVGVAVLLVDVDVLGRELALDDGAGQRFRVGGGEAAVDARVPLHRGAHGQPALGGEVLGHADLLAVEQDRCAGQGEQHAVHHADAALVAAEHRRQPPAQPAVVELHVLVRTEGLEDLLALVLGQLVQGQLVVVAHERGPVRVARRLRAFGQRAGERAGVLARQREVHLLHADEVEAHRQLVADAVGVAEELHRVGVGQVDLAEQDALAVAAAQERAQVAQVVVRVGQVRGVELAVGLQQERDRVHPEAGQAELHPEPHDAHDLVAHLGVGDVEVGLVAVEAVQVVLAGGLVQLPQAGLLVREHDALRPVLRRLLGPHVPVALCRVLAGTGIREPRVLVGGVVHDQVGDDADAAVARGPHELDEVAERAQPRVHAVEVGDVVTVVAVGRGVERHEPQARHTELVQVVDALGEPAEVAVAVAVRVGVGLDVEAVDDGVLPPDVGGVGELHERTSGRTLAPKASMNGSSSWPTWCR